MLEIFLFGLETFGHPQAKKYATDLKQCFELLARNPKMGRIAVSLGADVRRHEHQSHIIIYEQAEFGILVLGIIHKRNMRRLTPH
jgi:toxin ParE1/3/4